MPHVVIKTYPITEKQKIKLSEEIVTSIMKVTGKPLDYISVDIKNIDENDWMENVYKTEIQPNLNSLYKKPGY